MLDFDCWFFCHQIVDAAKTRGWDWVTEADSNRVCHHRGRKRNVTELAKSLADERFKKVTIGCQDYSLCALKVDAYNLRCTPGYGSRNDVNCCFAVQILF